MDQLISITERTRSYGLYRANHRQSRQREKLHGPVTEEGKQRASRNSTSHGLTSKDVSIPAGLAAEFEALRAGLQSDLNPETPVQVVFFNQALSAAWLQFRCDRAESQLDTRVSEPGLDPLLDPNLEPASAPSIAPVVRPSNTSARPSPNCARYKPNGVSASPPGRRSTKR